MQDLMKNENMKIKIFNKVSKSADSIPQFARKRALDGPTCYTPPGSPFRGLAPYGCPPQCAGCARAPKTRNTGRMVDQEKECIMK